MGFSTPSYFSFTSNSQTIMAFLVSRTTAWTNTLALMSISGRCLVHVGYVRQTFAVRDEFLSDLGEGVPFLGIGVGG